MTDTLVEADECVLDDVFGKSLIMRDDECDSHGFDLIPAHQRFQAANVTILETVNALPIIHGFLRRP
jgi:hypothetical protein